MSLTRHDTTIYRGPVLLEQMPTELLEFILSSFESLDTLWNLLRASPRCWHIFAIRYASITETVLSGPNSTTPLQVSKLIRAVALVRAHKAPFTSLKAFREDFLFEVTHPPTNPDDFRRIGHRDNGRPYTTFGSPSLPHQYHVITSVVATAYHISTLAQSLLANCLERLEASNFPCGPPATGPRPADKFEFIHGMGQPTYVEEMRAVRALWIIQLVGEVKAMVQTKPYIFCWPSFDNSRLSRLNPICIVPLCNYARDEVKAMMDYLPACYKNGTTFRLPQAPTPSQYNRWATMHPRVMAALGGDETLSLEVPSHGSHFLPPMFVAETKLHRLGFAFWDHSRMYSLGLNGVFTFRLQDIVYRYLIDRRPLVKDICLTPRHVCGNTFLTRRYNGEGIVRDIF